MVTVVTDVTTTNENVPKIQAVDGLEEALLALEKTTSVLKSVDGVEFCHDYFGDNEN